MCCPATAQTWIAIALQERVDRLIGVMFCVCPIIYCVCVSQTYNNTVTHIERNCAYVIYNVHIYICIQMIKNHACYTTWLLSYNWSSVCEPCLYNVYEQHIHNTHIYI